MKQLIQSYKTGEIRLVDVPVPSVKRGHILVKTMASLVSIGTEKHMLEMAKKSLLGKAIARPDLVRQVINKAKTEGVMEAYRQAMGRLDMPVLLGYSSSGIVIDVAPVEYASHSTGQGFKVGDRVACTGSGYAGHTEVALVPENLCVKIPKRQSLVLVDSVSKDKEEKPITNNESTNNYVSFEEAAFAALGGIALEAVRLANVGLGEYVAVIGMGLIGQIVVQILNSAGCHVMGFDVRKNRIDMALKSGAEAGSFDKDEFINLVREVTKGNGADAVIIFAATKSNQPLDLASEISRERARIVAGGLIGLNVPRKEFYEKELELVVSRAWGPGVYDNEFLNKNLKYPYAYVRWDAKRNIEEFLNLLAKGKVRVDHLISHRFSI
ncbi:MAG TPA: zinc-binding alcohol dehydrogenase, partial [Candidatus Atribacteria bacterium]|nr:zinc-binding alcohol dehydrogenase [Candidatus Atribacteria bacterium]